MTDNYSENTMDLVSKCIAFMEIGSGKLKICLISGLWGLLRAFTTIMNRSETGQKCTFWAIEQSNR